MSNVYLDNNRIIKMKDVDKYLNKIGTWRENKKDITIGALAVLLSCAMLYAGIKRFQKNNMYITIESKKIDKQNQNDNTYFYMSKTPIEKQR